eukprot:4491004-Amphidinium_carterae.1
MWLAEATHHGCSRSGQSASEMARAAIAAVIRLTALGVGPRTCQQCTVQGEAVAIPVLQQ